MDFRNFCLTFCLVLFCISPVNGKEIAKNLTTISSIPLLTKNQGYLVLYIDVAGVAPSIELSKVSTRKLDIIPADKKLKFGNTYTFDLKGLEKGFYYVPMLEGVYQVTKVNAPFYDLPYWIPTQDDPRWRFSVHKEKFNFIGELNIAKERLAKIVDINLYNRIATHQQALKSELEQVQGAYNLISTPGYRDEFFQELEK